MPVTVLAVKMSEMTLCTDQGTDNSCYSTNAMLCYYLQELQELELKASHRDNTIAHVNNSGSSNNSRLVYPDVYGIRISPSGTKVVAVYSDRR
jgi:hypothetical protein